MHAPVWKRTNPSQIIGLALALGLAASIALNVVMLTRSDGNEAASISTQTGVGLLAQQRYYAAKEARQDALDAAAVAVVARRGALTASQQNYFDRKSDEMNGITAATTTLNPALRNYYNRKSDEMDGIVTQPSTTLTPSLKIYSALKADQLNGSMTQSSTTVGVSQQLYVDLKSDQMDGIASISRAASQQRYVDLKSDQMDGIAAGQ